MIRFMTQYMYLGHAKIEITSVPELTRLLLQQALHSKLLLGIIYTANKYVSCLS